MSRLTAETLSTHTTDAIKQLLRLAAERVRRPVATTVKILVLEYARQHGLQVLAEMPPPALRAKEAAP